MHTSTLLFKIPLAIILCCLTIETPLGAILPITYFSRIKAPKVWDNPTPPRVYHLGQIIHLDEDLSFSLPIPPSMQQLRVLITADLLAPTSNTFDHYQLKPNASYKHYVIVRNSAYLEAKAARDSTAISTEQPWNIAETPINPEAIDPTTLVIIMPAIWVKAVACEEAPAGSNPFQLPVIALDDNLSEQEFNDMSVILRLACLNSDPLHHKQTFVTKVTNNQRMTYVT